MHYLGLQIIKEKLMACIIFFVGSEKSKQRHYYVFPYCNFTHNN